ncbi:hypothetical protein TrispH2_006921 [Trichoplax sp. H2]|uniref:Uncharacterized protein n=1 Tax=Trichoplax adhaerens TaxID=10228 RepID=B3S5H4_TRIAD|nr:predicted protein [Trichoplax adhaerens]EDV21915.1 predicted protein [Trichoplax adhaerens]RDD41279.1 hypothetical protein TrispH2_006921 [Trichoplax sp. H2]|eukprot:XP_002115552.1 predicted protein [Trichoplax adhaerens]
MEDDSEVQSIRNLTIDNLTRFDENPSENNYDEYEAILGNKNNVYRKTLSLLRQCKTEDVASKFEIVIRQHKGSLDYWDVDGGFAAMALLGEAFTQTLANYFIARVDSNPCRRFRKAFSAIDTLYDQLHRLVTAGREIEAMNACLSVIPYFIKHFNTIEDDDQLCKQVRKLLRRAQNNIFQNFFQLKTKVSDMHRLHSKDLLSILLSRNELINEFGATILQALFWIASELEIVITIEKSNERFFLKALTFNSSWEILKDDNNAIASIFDILQNFLLEKLSKESSNKQKVLGDKEKWQFLGDSHEEKIEDFTFRLLRDVQEGHARFELIKEFLSDGEKTAKLYKILHRHKLITEEIANQLLIHCELYITEDRKLDRWPADGGIQAVAYVGKFFNERFSNFLVTRANMWFSIYMNEQRSNLLLAIKALQMIEKTLHDSSDIDDSHQTALESLRKCREELPYFESVTKEILEYIRPF